MHVRNCGKDATLERREGKEGGKHTVFVLRLVPRAIAADVLLLLVVRVLLLLLAAEHLVEEAELCVYNASENGCEEEEEE